MPTIRAATPADATHLACFIDMASEGLAGKVWEAVRGPHETLFEAGRGRSLRETGAFSYRNGRMAEVDGVVVGGMISYRLPEDHDPNFRTRGSGPEKPPPAFLTPLIELEAFIRGYWYVNILAAYPERRGGGVGRALLTEADRLCADAGAKGAALIVDSANRPDGGEWLLMTKPRP